MAVNPNPQDYSDAIQNLTNLNDADLQNGLVESDKFGLPLVWSGNFGSVYKIKNGSLTYGVKCFYRQHQDMRERYELITECERTGGVPGGISMCFIDRGIRIHGDWYPILKMHWLNGSLLHEYIANNLGDKKALNALTKKWRTLVSRLRSSGIAHGDLQNGNILVLNDEIRLIDYDNMFVPKLAGRVSHEQGHPNFQHPNRTSEFGAYLDNFSSWAILLSLMAIAEEPDRFSKIAAIEEQLLFRKSDFTEPASSQIFAELLNEKNSEIRKTAELLSSFLTLDVRDVPPLPTALPDWMTDPDPVPNPIPQPNKSTSPPPPPPPLSPTPSPVPPPQPIPAPTPPKLQNTYLNAMPVRKIFILGMILGPPYQFYWFYRNWVYLLHHWSLRIAPKIRFVGLFLPIIDFILIYQQLKWIKDRAAQSGIAASYTPSVIASLYLMQFVLPGMLGDQNPQRLVAFSTFVIMLNFFSLLALVPVQNTLNEMSGLSKDQIAQNARLTGADYGWICVSGIVWAIAIYLVVSGYWSQ